MAVDEDEMMRLLQNNPQLQPTASQRFMQGAKSFMGDRDLAMALLANSGYSPQRRSFGQVLGQSYLQAGQMKDQRSENELMKRYREAQIQSLGNRQTNQAPNSVQEYEYARQNGFKGSFQDWITAGGQSSRPSSVQEWEFYNALPEDKKPLYLEMKRNPNFKVQEINQAPTVVQGGVGGKVNLTPLSTTQSEIAASAARKGAESEAGAVGTGTGNIAVDITKKGSNAKSTMATLDLADPLIDAATGSATGAAADKLAAFFGEAPKGAQAIAQLRVLQANLMTSMPRMEGPQSDRDVELYRQAAGQIGDPMIPNEIKKAAVQTIRALQQKYVERADTNSKKRRYNPDTGKIE